MDSAWPTCTRRAFLRGAGAGVLALALGRLEPARAATTAAAWDYRDWEDVYRAAWRWDRVVKGTHLRANCVSACAWDVYVKDGIVWREEQAAGLGRTAEGLADFNPRGCQKGACYSTLMHGPARLRHPLRRVGPRGAGRWKRITWEEALTEVADTVIDVCVGDGPECLVYDGGTTNVDFGPDTAAEMRLVNLLGATTLDSNGAAVGDAALGAVQTWGMGFVDGTADDWMHADHLLVWCMNPSATRIPEAHFLSEARYRGTRVVVVTPDYNATAIHADLWLNPRVGSDAALALGLAQVIVAEGLHQVRYVQEQTDLPLLVRADTGRFLREEDVRRRGRPDVFYVWDRRSGRPAPAPGAQGDARATLALGDLDPDLEGAHRVRLRDGGAVTVRPVFALLRDRLAAYTPERAARLCGVRAGVIRALARDLAQARTALVLASFGACKHHHSDLLQRALILLVALTGNQGRHGGGLRIAAWWSMAGFEELASAWDAPFYVDLLGRWLTPSVRQLEGYIADFSRRRYLMTPALLWLHVHGGLATADPASGEAVAESIRRGWMPVYPQPGRRPRMLLCTGGNPLRRWPVPRRVTERLWAQLDSVVSVNFRMSTTALSSDIVLPAAGWYEKRGIKYAQTYLPYVVVGDRAVEPLGEARSEWEIFGLLARRIQERARARGVAPYRDALGIERDLRVLGDLWSGNGRFPVEDEEKALDHVIGRSEPTRGLTWRAAAERGAVAIRAPGRYGPVSGTCSDLVAGETVAPSRWFVDRKEPWPTLTGRQQFYLDHPWFLAADEALPCHKEPPGGGARHPLRLTGGHTRWSIHAIWRDEAALLRLQRGEPVAYLSLEDAAARGVRDHDAIRIYNDAGSCQLRAKPSAAVQPGQVIVYHAWEPYQFPRWESAQEPIDSPLKALHLVGDYGQLHYRTGHQAPGYAPRGTAVEVERVAGGTGA